MIFLHVKRSGQIGVGGRIGRVQLDHFLEFPFCIAKRVLQHIHPAEVEMSFDIVWVHCVVFTCTVSVRCLLGSTHDPSEDDRVVGSNWLLVVLSDEKMET